MVTASRRQTGPRLDVDVRSLLRDLRKADTLQLGLLSADRFEEVVASAPQSAVAEVCRTSQFTVDGFVNFREALSAKDETGKRKAKSERSQWMGTGTEGGRLAPGAVLGSAVRTVYPTWVLKDPMLNSKFQREVSRNRQFLSTQDLEFKLNSFLSVTASDLEGPYDMLKAIYRDWITDNVSTTQLSFSIQWITGQRDVDFIRRQLVAQGTRRRITWNELIKLIHGIVPSLLPPLDKVLVQEASAIQKEKNRDECSTNLREYERPEVIMARTNYDSRALEVIDFGQTVTRAGNTIRRKDLGLDNDATSEIQSLHKSEWDKRYRAIVKTADEWMRSGCDIPNLLILLSIQVGITIPIELVNRWATAFDAGNLTRGSIIVATSRILADAFAKVAADKDCCSTVVQIFSRDDGQWERQRNSGQMRPKDHLKGHHIVKEGHTEPKRDPIKILNRTSDDNSLVEAFKSGFSFPDLDNGSPQKKIQLVETDDRGSHEDPIIGPGPGPGPVPIGNGVFSFDYKPGKRTTRPGNKKTQDADITQHCLPFNR